MEYRQLGNAGMKVSVLGMGSYLTIGMSVDDATSKAIVQRAYDLGVNFFDTANAYNHGEAEKVLGKQLADLQRDSLVIAEGMGLKPSQLALAWTLRRPEVCSAIMGASKVSQLEENIAAVEIDIPDDILKPLDELFPGPPETYPL